MKITGFSCIKNAVKYDYPIVEAVKSILPICDDFVISVGKSDDNTLDIIKKIAPSKIKILKTVWDSSIRKGGKVLALETDKAFKEIAENSDWAFYIQGDEIVHEKYLDTIYNAMNKYKDTKKVDGLLFKYLHFYGAYNYVGTSPSWYRNEIRVIRNKKNIYSYRDAQGFRKDNNKKLNVESINAYIYHYGHSRHPKSMDGKSKAFYQLYHKDNELNNKDVKFQYSTKTPLKKFEDTHPKVMEDRVKNRDWEYTPDLSKSYLSLKDKVKLFSEKILGHQIGEYRNYKKL